MTQMMTCRRLPGLPAYGPMATGFPAGFGRFGQEGLVVEFSGPSGTSWVGNFCPGLGGLDDVRWHPNKQRVLVASARALWSVDPESRVGEEMGPPVFNIWELDDGDLLIDNQGLLYLRLGRSGVVWDTHRISWDGFRNVRLEAGQLTGEASCPGNELWLPFSVDLQTGRVDGGSYTGMPEMHFDYSRLK